MYLRGFPTELLGFREGTRGRGPISLTRELGRDRMALMLPGIAEHLVGQ